MRASCLICKHSVCGAGQSIAFILVLLIKLWGVVMITDYVSKSALCAARLALLAGVSVATLGFANSANAQITYGPNAPATITYTGYGVYSAGYGAQILSNGTFNSFFGPTGATIDGSVITSYNATTSTTITPTNITSKDANGGSTSITGGTVAISGGTNTNAGGISTLVPANAALNISGGAYITNGLAVTGGESVTGNSTFNGNTQTNGNAAVTGNAKVGGSLTVTGQTTVNDLAVNPGSTVSMGGNEVQNVGTPIFGTDAANKAYVDLTVNKARNQAYEGTAVALAISQPVFLPGQSFAIRGGYGEFEGQNAAGFSAAGVIARDMFGYGSTVSVDAGVGVGTNYNGVGAKAGVTLGFGGGYVPLK